MNSQEIQDALKRASEGAQKIQDDLQAAARQNAIAQLKREQDEKEYNRLVSSGCTPGQAKFAMSLKLPK